MPHADLGEFRMYYEGAGEGEALVFLHGFSLDCRMWRPQVEFFRDAYHVITPDARGHGLSDAPLSGYSRADRVQDLVRLLDYLKIESLHLVGLSMGGATAIGFALAHEDRLKSLTLVSTGAAGYSAGKKFSGLDQVAREKGVEAALGRWKAWALGWYKDDQSNLRSLLDTMISAYSGAVWRDPMRGQYPREDDLSRASQIKVPAAIFAGALDKMWVPLARQLHERVAGSRLTVYPDTGHMLNLEQPAQFNADLKVFLEGL
ncbi:MAG: alpha/beta fold hydrolase [Candidatus Zixiibacteriota bacterium]